MKKNKALKIVTIVGTRPELIRLSQVLRLLDQHVNHVLVHTGQNYDFELSEIFFNELEIRSPDYFLNVKSDSLGAQLGKILVESEKVFLKEKPDAVLILGDTNSSISGIIAKRLKIPIFHMEAGNRCFDQNVPEELNRKIIDHVADFNLVYTEHARRHLLSEGIHHRKIYLTGSPMREVLNGYSEKILQSRILHELKLKEQDYFVASIHREENIDNAQHLKNLILSLNALAVEYDKTVILSTHPRTLSRIEALTGVQPVSRVVVHKPFGFFDYITLQKNSLCTLSDSGTISEESAILNFPAVTLRNATERPESLDSGTILMTGLDLNTILKCVELAIIDRNRTTRECPLDYQIQDTSWRVLKLIFGVTRLRNRWDGIEMPQSSEI